MQRSVSLLVSDSAKTNEKDLSPQVLWRPPNQGQAWVYKWISVPQEEQRWKGTEYMHLEQAWDRTLCFQDLIEDTAGLTNPLLVRLTWKYLNEYNHCARAVWKPTSKASSCCVPFELHCGLIYNGIVYNDGKKCKEIQLWFNHTVKTCCRVAVRDTHKSFSDSITSSRAGPEAG